MTAEITETPPAAAPVPAGPASAMRAAAIWQARSIALAAEGDTRLAVQTQWAADLATLHCLLWESGLASVPDPGAQLDTVAHVVCDAFLRVDQPGADGRSLIARSRAALGEAFGPSVAALLAERFSALDHLGSVGEPAAGDSASAARAARGAEALLRDLRDVAADCAAVAQAMAAADLAHDAADQLRRAQLATFEAFLVSQAVSAGHPGLTAADLRWELARGRLSPRAWTELAPDALADELVASVEPADRASLRTRLDALR